MNKYLPIGSIVVLKNADKKLMIYGRKQKDTGNGNIRDYVRVCLENLVREQ